MRGEEHGSGYRNKGHTKAGWGESKMCAGKPESDLHNKNETGGAKRTLPVAATFQEISARQERRGGKRGNGD